jgi:hypothetical protein
MENRNVATAKNILVSQLINKTFTAQMYAPARHKHISG